MATATGEDQLNRRIVRVSDIAKEPCKMLMPIGGYEDIPTVSLEEAVEPLLSLLPDVQRHVYVAKERCENPPPDGLTIDESAAIMLYSMNWKPRDQCLYVALNATLRSEDREQLEPWFLYLNLFFTALERLPYVQRTVYRGIKLIMQKDYPIGKSIVWWGFSTCTTSTDVLEKELFFGTTTARTIFTIECNAGKDIQNHSYIRSENEILLLAATQFKVVANHSEDNGLLMIQLQETTPPFPLRPVIRDPSPEKPHPNKIITTTPQAENDHASPVATEENNVLVWLDSSIDESKDSYGQTISKLRQVINTIKTFTHRDQCIQFLKDNKDKNIFVIISGSLGEGTVSIIHDMSQITGIFIFCGNKSLHEKWATKWSKTKGVFVTTNDLCEVMKQVIEQCNQQMIPISFISQETTPSKQHLDQLDPSFMHTQVLKEILLQIVYDDQHIKDFLNYCREQFSDNETELKNCTKIQQEYSKHKPIWWYTYQSFLYPMLNKALRTMDVDILIQMGFFIRDLHRQIEELYSEQFDSNVKPQSFTVYRGQVLSQTDFDQLMKTKGGLLSFNNFLSTFKNRATSLPFAEKARNTSDLIGIIFVMNINPSISSVPFAAIKDFTFNKDSDEEILFSMHSVFRISDIKKLDNSDRLWQVDLILTSDTDLQLDTLTEHLRKETEGSSGWNRLGKFLFQLGEINKAETLYNTLLSRIRDIREKSILYDQLGIVKNSQGEYQQAITLYEKALEIHRNTLPSDHPDFVQSYNNIALVYNNMTEYAKAVSFYEKALEIRQKILPPDHPDFAESYNNIGFVYNNMGEHSKALFLHDKALDIHQKGLPPNHPDLARSYSNMGLVYNSMGEYSRAISIHEKALEIRQKSLPPDHPDIAESYNNIASVHNNTGESNKALSFQKKVLEIRQKGLPPNHPELARSYSNMGLVYNSMGEYSEAISFYEKALEIRQKILPPGHLDIAESYNKIASVHNNMGEYAKALSFQEKVLEIRQKGLPPNHADLARAYSNMGLVYDSMGEHSKAISFHEKVLEIHQTTLPPNHPDIAESYNNIASLYNNMGEYAKALSFQEKVLEIRQTTLPSDHLKLAETYYNIGSLFENLNIHSKALKFCKQAIEIGQSALPPQDPTLEQWQTKIDTIESSYI